MQQVVVIVFPVFALIAVGFLAGRSKLIGEASAKGLAEFTFQIAVPAMMFRTMATAHLPDVAPLAVWAAYFGTVFTSWALATLAVPLVLRRPMTDSAPIAMSAGFGNVVMLGIPLSIGSLGEAAAGPIALIISLHTPTLWTLATVHLALTNRDHAKSAKDTALSLLRDLSRNGIILAILAGTLWRLTGFGLDPVVEKSLGMLGQAAIPSALVALGLSLNGFRIAGQTPTLAMILVLKLVLMPVTAWFLATDVLMLPPLAAGVVVIFAAMPTGANAFLFASQYGRAMNSASGAVALGTAMSIVTASVLLATLFPAAG